LTVSCTGPVAATATDQTIFTLFAQDRLVSDVFDFARRSLVRFRFIRFTASNSILAGVLMNVKKTVVIVLCLLSLQSARDVARGQASQAPSAVGVAIDIPGVIKGGTTIERIKEGFSGLDDPIGLMDGTLVFSEPGTRRLHKLDPKTNQSSVLVAESNESHGVSQDSKGRLISAQALDGSTRIGVIYPPGSQAVLADNFEGKPFSRPNDVIVAKSGAVYFTEPGLTAQQADALVKKQGGKPLAPRLPPAVYFIPPGGKAIRIEEKLIRPNGISLSRDEKTLYVAQSDPEAAIRRGYSERDTELVLGGNFLRVLTEKANFEAGVDLLAKVTIQSETEICVE
jgi:hypothetical protein